MSAVLGLLHGADYLVTHLLLGSIIFYAFILPAGGADAIAIENQKTRALRRLSVATLLTSTLWMILSVTDMTESWLPSEIWSGMSRTTFGHYWCIRIGVLFAFVLTVKPALTNPIGKGLLFLMALSLPLFSALTGHAAAQPDHVVFRETLVLLHSVAVAIWTGGLFRLYSWLDSRLEQESVRPEMTHSVVQRFSYFAVVSTGVIGLTGIGMAYLAGVSPFRPLSTDYGKLVFAKTVLFVMALGAAAINHFVHLRQWESNQERDFALAIRREVSFEGAFIACIFGAAGFLARTSM